MFLNKIFLLFFFALTSGLVAGRSCKATRPKSVLHHSKPSSGLQAHPVMHHGPVQHKGSKTKTKTPKHTTSFISTTSLPEPTNNSQPPAPSKTTTVVPAPSQTSTTGTSPSEKFIGLGTRYGGSCTEEDCWQNGACSFVGYDLPPGIDGTTCVSDAIWNNGANCGGCISVSYKGKTITVMVTNETGGNATHLDMTPSTWSKLTNGYSGGGVDGIEWEWVTCPIAETTPLWIKMHGGASKYWFAATVENARERTAKLEVSSDQGATWKPTVLNNYNMWTLDGTLPDDTAWVRVTGYSGSKVVVENVKLASGVITEADGNYA
ncbi:hypothetical protein NLU13_6572 [Sarocladium strictum]|uniref:Expansin-like EG45 domain-containing protein n=1 Tax=Sarocladium strictum TaxID=5046 RepID=A0AA39GGH4_SARSR|nr:hypothetical protein NLU13_6572 [Sarocladium strictum]